MAFPSNPTNGQIATRFGRRYQYNSTTGQWRGVQAVASNTIVDLVDSDYIAARVDTFDSADVSNIVNEQYISSLGFDTVSSRIKYMTMNQAGTITAPFTGIARSYPPININITSIAASVGTTPTADLVFDILKNGVSVGTYTITAGAYKLSPASVTILVQTTDYLSININSGTGATDLKVDFTYTAA